MLKKCSTLIFQYFIHSEAPLSDGHNTMWWNRVRSACKMMFGTNWECVRPARNRVIMLPCCAGWTEIGGTSEAPFITPNSTNAGGICKQAPKFLFQPNWQCGWRRFFLILSLCERHGKWRQASYALRSVKMKNQSALPNSVLQHDKTITVVSSVSIQTERKVWVREMSYMCAFVIAFAILVY